MTLGTATLPVIRALLDLAASKHYSGGVLGVQARPEWDGPAEFDHNGCPVRVVQCTSVLAIREALLDRAPDRWLVVLTDRDNDELGLGITAHLVFQRLRRPDPWEAVKNRFQATRVDQALYAATDSRQVATGLLAASPVTGWPPVRAGLLTADHCLGAVAHARLGLGGPDTAIDLPAVLRWSTRIDAGTAVSDLRALGGDPLTATLIDWLADRCGVCSPAVSALLTSGRTTDLVPLGLVARAVLATEPGSGPRALLGRELGISPSPALLQAWPSAAEQVTRELLDNDPDAAARVMSRAESLVDHLDTAATAASSTLLQRSLTDRLAELGELLRRCAQRAPARNVAGGADGALADPVVLPEVESAWERVREHALADRTGEVRVPRALAAVRLARWLAADVSPASTLAEHVARHRDEDAWVDRAVADAWTGVDDEALAQGLRAVLGAVRLRRDTHDQAFAVALASHAGELTEPVPIENLLHHTVLPLARRAPVLLVVVDGMSQAVATEIVEDVVHRYEMWLECLPDGRERRIAALAALPSLTTVSRTSLFCGELTIGEQDEERAGLAKLARAHGVTADVFYKLALDRSDAGFALAHDVADAIDNIDGLRLVACVLNTIDDALDRSDPGGTQWTTDTVKHLRALLDRARRAGRIVVLTSDHGHVVERREGRVLSGMTTSSNRSRAYIPSSPAGDGEIRVRGRRVLLHDADAVLAVEERLRYGPVKAGYHGGAAPAEVVVPVSVLVTGAPPEGWRLAPPQSPWWWRGSAPELPPTAAKTAVDAPAMSPRRKARNEAPALFDLQTEPPPVIGPAGLADAVLASDTYAEQRRRATRVLIKDDQVRALLSALLAAPDHRLDSESVAAALGLAVVQLAGALPQVQRLLNVEQYPVLDRDPDGQTVLLDVDLLRDQFGVRS